MAEVTLEMLQALVLRVLDEQKETRREMKDTRREMKDTRREMTDVRTLVLALVDQGQRLDRRFGELRQEVHEIKDEVELMLKAEIMGRQGNFETRIDARLDAFSDRIGLLESRPEPAP